MLNSIDLNDNWLFSKVNDPSYERELLNEGEFVTLPHCWNSVDGQGGSEEYFRGACWYQRKLSIKSEYLEEKLFLEIGAAGNVGKVYINGVLTGESKCGFSMFRVPLNKHLKIGENLISIMVDNSYYKEVFPLMADFTFYGGLYREVKLLVMEDLHFDLLDNSRDGIYLNQKKITNDTFELEICGKLINESSQTKEGEIKLQLNDQDGNVILNKDIRLEINREKEFRIIEVIRNPILWEGIENPYLYSISVEVNIHGQTYDVRNLKIGFRTLEVTSDRGVFLNGRPIKLKGVSRHQDYAGVGNALTKRHMEEDMSIIKDIGANSIRLAHYQHDDYFYSLCDSQGMLVWAEIPFISMQSTKDPSNRNAKEQLEKLIKQAYNHCSIICWGIQNEITIAMENHQTYEIVKELENLAKKLDPFRLTSQANIYSVENNNVLNDITDIVGYNLYYGWYYGEKEGLGERLDEFHLVNPYVPVLVSEYGVDTNPNFHTYSPKVKDYSEEYQLEFHHNALKTMNERPFVLGGYVWNMFDFGSANRNEGGDRGKNLKGLVSIDRKLKKDAYYLYKAYWSNEPFVHIVGRRFVNRHKTLNDITVLTNQSHIKIYIDNIFLAELISDEPMKVIRDFPLSIGENHIRVEAVNEGGIIYIDEITLNHVKEIDKNYIYVSEVENKNVTNWFEKFDLSNVQEVTLKDGYYSTFDTVEELFRSECAKNVFRKFFGKLDEEPRFEVMKGVMTIEKMAKVSFFKIPKELLPVINKELNAIQKITDTERILHSEKV